MLARDVERSYMHGVFYSTTNQEFGVVTGITSGHGWPDDDEEEINFEDVIVEYAPVTVMEAPIKSAPFSTCVGIHGIVEAQWVDRTMDAVYISPNSERQWNKSNSPGRFYCQCPFVQSDSSIGCHMMSCTASDIAQAISEQLLGNTKHNLNCLRWSMSHVAIDGFCRINKDLAVQRTLRADWWVLWYHLVPIGIAYVNANLAIDRIKLSRGKEGFKEIVSEAMPWIMIGDRDDGEQ